MILKEGTMVTYKTEYAEEKGRVKSIPNEEFAFVVYSCDGNWNDYKDYTAERTRISDLELGWDN